MSKYFDLEVSLFESEPDRSVGKRAYRRVQECGERLQIAGIGVVADSVAGNLAQSWRFAGNESSRSVF